VNAALDLTRPPNDCLFCRRQNTSFQRVEHPIPESLGNDDFILPPGWVCDACNQYFGAKIEARVLSMPPFSIERAAFSVTTKKGRLPLHQDDGFALAATGFTQMLAIVDQGNTVAARRVMETGVYIPDTPPRYDDFMIRFMLKVGLEVLLAHQVDVYDGRYDLARRCARYGERVHEWDLAYGVYPRRKDLLLARRWDALGAISTHQIYQFDAGVMDSGDVMFNFIYATSMMAVNLSRPPATEYILGFNARNSFALRSRWSYKTLPIIGRKKR
jgi:hypothetical protein